MSEGDALWGALSRVATEAARTVRAAAESASRELSGALGKDQLKWPAGLSLAGPTVPQPYKPAGQTLSWQVGGWQTCWLKRRCFGPPHLLAAWG